MGPSYYLKTSSKFNLKSTNQQQRKINRDENKYDPKKDRPNVAFHKARKDEVLINQTVSQKMDIQHLELQSGKKPTMQQIQTKNNKLLLLLV